VGQPLTKAAEAVRLSISEDDRKGGAQRANSEIARAMEGDRDRISSAISQGLQDEDEITDQPFMHWTAHRTKIYPRSSMVWSLDDGHANRRILLWPSG